MMKMPALCIVASALVMGASGFANVSHAATPGSDNANQPAYKDGWSSGVNGGTGFKAWKLVTSDSGGPGGFFVGDSKNMAGGSGGDINSNGKSFGMFAHGPGKTAEAFRSFDAPLEVGQTFSVEIVVMWRNGNKGFDLRSAGDEKSIFNLNVGSDDYVVNNAATGNGSIGTDYSDHTVFKLMFAQTSGTGGTWTLTRRGGISKSANGTYTGVAGGLKFYVNGTDEGPQNDLNVNNLVIAAK